MLLPPGLRSLGTQCRVKSSKYSTEPFSKALKAAAAKCNGVVGEEGKFEEHGDKARRSHRPPDSEIKGMRGKLGPD